MSKVMELIKREWENQDAQRGIVWGLIAAFAFLALFGQSDTSLYLDYIYNDVPYGLLWTWLNPMYWTQQPYMLLVSLVEVPFYALQWFLVRKKKLTRNLVLMNFFSTVFFNATHVFQEGTKIMFAPLVVINPVFLIPMILQTFPLGWSVLPWQSSNWTCGIVGHCLGFGIENSRLSIARSDFITHIALVFWMVAPLLLWYRNKTGRMPFLKQFEWADRHKKILFIGWFGFMMFLVLYAALTYPQFFTWTEGD